MTHTVGSNLSLRAKLKQDFGVALPELPDAQDQLDVDAYFAAVETAISEAPRWRVDRHAIELGFFSFGKFLMYNDLDVGQWPEGVSPEDHFVITSLLGDGFPEAEHRFDDGVHLDEHLAPGEVHHVVDADSTQILAMLDAMQGHNLVIQGPPGTGKSQTITNLVAEALGQQKTILFVSEKMAALEVVKRRLDSLGLGDACLELHSHKTKKKDLLAELERTLSLGKPKLSSFNEDLEVLTSARTRLNAYSRALNTPIGASGLSPYRVFGRLLRLQEASGAELPVLGATQIRAWSGEQFAKRRELAERLQALLAQMGLPPEHPFWGSRRTLFLPTEKPQIIRAAEDARDATERVETKGAELADGLQLPRPKRPNDASLLCRAARRALEAPDLYGVELKPAEWAARSRQVDALLGDGKRLGQVHEEYDALFIPEAWSHDMLQIRQPLAAHGKKWWRFLIGDFRRAKNALAGLCQASLPKAAEERLAAVESIMEAQRLVKTIEAHDEEGRKLFSAQWQGADSDWPVLERITGWVRELHASIDRGEIPRGLLDFLAGGPELEAMEPLIAEVEVALETHAERARTVGKLLDIDTRIRFNEEAPFAEQPFAAQQTLYEACLIDLDRLQEIVSYNHLAKALHEEELAFLLELAERWPYGGAHLADALSFNWLSELAAHALEERPVLAGFDGASHRHTVETFCRLDEATFEHNRTRLALEHWKAMPRSSMMGQMGVLLREFQKKRRHLPIRKLMEKGGNAIKAIKPVFMMSPMSIATYLPPGSVTFDLVVFDEASQVKPVEAFGAILRGGQTVVVGDSKQLPPTSFFDTVTDDVMDEDDEGEGTMKTGDVESILSLFNAKGAPERMLRWHYRSRHDSLIAVSNREFYNNRLVTFPSPVSDRTELGVRYHFLPDTFYDRGGSRANKDEARAVSQAVMRHAKAHPNLTLGVATFSEAQATEVQNQLELLRRQDPSCEAFFNAHGEEPFFVKNLENVQGDERDVILISVGYGRDQHGKFTLNFGPLNRDGGERRLNVLITRARRRCEVFTNLRADDIDLTRTNARGVLALKRYLQFAETGRVDMPEPTDRDPDSAFEEAVADGLRAHGVTVHPQVGSAGYFIDLAVVDPEKAGRYLLGIECDGAAYHSARSARDRDRIRQSVLEGLGWRLHRIWSTDWFRHPERELRKALEAIEAAKARSGAPPPGPREVQADLPSATPVEREQDDEQGADALPSVAYRTAALQQQQLFAGDLHEESTTHLASLLRQVVHIESPVHFDDAARRILDAYGVSRLGSRIRKALEHAARYGTRQGWLRREGSFLFDPEQTEVPIRDRSMLDPSTKKLDLVSPAEIDAAVAYVVGHAFGISAEDVPNEACTLLGFSRVTSDMRETVEKRITALVEAGQLRLQNGHLVLVEDEAGPDAGDARSGDARSGLDDMLAMLRRSQN